VRGGLPGRIGPYVVEGELGRGGMGVVARARHAHLGRPVALKLMQRRALGQKALARFRTEALTTARLRHPGIVPIHEAGSIEGCPYLVMDLVEGESLADRIARAGPLPPRKAAELGVALARAIDYAHGEGVLHRDLKPPNVLLDASGAPRITDFGLAKDLLADERLTATGQLVGTPVYASPEQATGAKDRLGPATDVYGLGATLYEAFTGRPPFGGDTAMNVVVAVVRQAPTPPRELRPELDPDLEAICLRCLAKAPADRYPTAAALADALEGWLAGGAPGAGLGRRRAVAASLALAAALAVGLGLALGLAGGGEADGAAPAGGAPSPGPRGAAEADPGLDLEARLDELRRVEDPGERLALALALRDRAGDRPEVQRALRDATPWERVAPAAGGPPARHHHALCYDAAREVVVLFGGTTDGWQTFYDDLWLWDGASWHEVPRREPWPPPLFGHGMAYDPLRDRVVVFGALREGHRDICWEWDGARWHEATASPRPAPRAFHRMLWDPHREAVVLFGGDASREDMRRRNDLWTWDGRAWRVETALKAPPGRHGFGFAYDPERRVLVVYGGYDDDRVFGTCGSTTGPRGGSATRARPAPRRPWRPRSPGTAAPPSCSAAAPAGPGSRATSTRPGPGPASAGGAATRPRPPPPGPGAPRPGTRPAAGSCSSAAAAPAATSAGPGPTGCRSRPRPPARRRPSGRPGGG